MRRSLLLLAVLRFLAAGGICLAVPAVNGQKEAVTVTELLRYGDASAAEGLTVGIATNYDLSLIHIFRCGFITREDGRWRGELTGTGW